MHLSDDQLKQYDADGFLIVHNVFKAEELKPLQEEVDGLVDDLAQRLKRAGKITDLHEDQGFYYRLTALDRIFPAPRFSYILAESSSRSWRHYGLLRSFWT